MTAAASPGEAHRQPAWAMRIRARSLNDLTQRSIQDTLWRRFRRTRAAKRFRFE